MISLAVVLIVAAPPDAGLVAPAWRAVQPRVHAPQDVDPALVGGVGVVDGAVLERERAYAGPLAPVGLPVLSEGRLAPGVPGTLLAGRRPATSGAGVPRDC